MDIQEASKAKHLPKETIIEVSGRSCEESEVDGLIKWAKELPDDIPL